MVYDMHFTNLLHTNNKNKFIDSLVRTIECTCLFYKKIYNII